MNVDDFEKLVHERILNCLTVLSEKDAEYAGGGDKLHNFKVATGFGSTFVTPEEALWGMFRKHLVSISDLVEATKFGAAPSKKMMDAKITDAINYLYLLEALFTERNIDYKNEDFKQ